MGYVYQVREGYEYRGKAIGAYRMEWVARSDKRDLITVLEQSLQAVKKRKSRAKQLDAASVAVSFLINQYAHAPSSKTT